MKAGRDTIWLARAGERSIIKRPRERQPGVEETRKKKRTAEKGHGQPEHRRLPVSRFVGSAAGVVSQVRRRKPVACAPILAGQANFSLDLSN